MSTYIAITVGAILGCGFGKAVYFPARPTRTRVIADERPRLSV